MPAEHLRALIERTAPGRSVRELTAAAGMPENRLGYWTKPGTELNRMPTMAQLRDLAQIIGCETGLVYEAFRKDVDGEAELDQGLAVDERALLATYRRLGEADRRRFLQIGRVLHGQGITPV